MSALSERTPAERFLSGEYRLACQAVVERDDIPLVVETLKRKPKILTTHSTISADLEPLTVRRGDDVIRETEKIDSYNGAIHGLAIDVGTTTVVAQLVDLESGELLKSVAFANPQIFGGNNVLHRINYDTADSNRELQNILISQLDGEIHRFGS